MGELKPWHIIILAIVLFVLFGYKKLPDATRSLGRSLRILKTEVKSLHDDEPETPPTDQPKVAAPPRAVGAPRPVVPEAGSPPVTPVAAGAPAATKPDAEHR
jgi:sec-independent protein translocase protein TatA